MARLSRRTAFRRRQLDVAVANQLLDLRPRVRGQHRHQEAVEPLTVELLRDGELSHGKDHEVRRRL
jgi:hypothetical protein